MFFILVLYCDVTDVTATTAVVSAKRYISSVAVS